MFKVTYINNSNDYVYHRGGFKSDKEAYEWVDQQGRKITPLKLLIWSEAKQSYRVIEEF